MRARKLRGLYALSLGGVKNAIAHEIRKRVFVEMLQLAAAAMAEMTARRHGVVRSRLKAAIRAEDISRRGEADMPTAFGDAVTLGGDPQNLFTIHYKNRRYPAETA
ncbi:hypothetical protein GCM10011515_11570 [Tsuneonella deserti]|uniref:Uncharacterized protein n=1 Tax=Tsuneonella deserti TaxID=2035528 RepID=A0ABQ1S7C5_9SPHN|nr:hypothetical protein GCM10011515_11570 [Tsuneonella deserti]